MSPINAFRFLPNWLLAVLTAAATLLIFVLDINAPLGIAGGLPYVLPVLMALGLPPRYRPIIVVAGASSLLTTVGFILSAPAETDLGGRWAVESNRLLALIVIWITALLCLALRRDVLHVERERQRLRNLIDTSADAVVLIDPNGIIQSFSRAGERLFGYREDELVGRNVSVLMPSPHRERHDSYIRRYLESGEPRVIGKGISIEALKKDGTRFPIHLTVGEVGKGDGRLFAGFIHDITARIEAQQAAAHERNFVQTILDTTEALVAVVDRTGHIVRFNRACERLTGYRAGEIVGEEFLKIVPEESRDIARAAFASLLSGEGVNGAEYPWSTKAGVERLIGWSNSTIRAEDGTVHYIVATGIDITEREQAQSKVRDLQHDLYKIGRVSELGEMASAIAHELNQPLTAISNYVMASRRVLARRRADSPANALGLMDKAVEQTERAGLIIRRLRQLIGRGQSELVSSDINAVIGDACALALIGAQEKGITVRLELAEDLPRVFIDTTQIQQVVFNLVRNSLDAMENAERRELVLRTSKDSGKFIEVTVCDTGAGLAPEIAEIVFMPFVTTKISGMGIGLPICRSIIDAHEGRLWVTPNAGTGVTFGFTLPIEQADEEGRNG